MTLDEREADTEGIGATEEELVSFDARTEVAELELVTEDETDLTGETEERLSGRSQRVPKTSK
jgi:hypothetical protein